MTHAPVDDQGTTLWGTLVTSVDDQTLLHRIPPASFLTWGRLGTTVGHPHLR